MNGSYDQRRNDSHDDDLGLGIVDEVASTARSARPAKARGWIFAVLGVVIILVLALVIFFLRSASSTNDTSALDAPDAISNTLELRSGGLATVTTSQSADALAVAVSEIPMLEESEQLIVWAVDVDGNLTVLLKSSGGEQSGGISPAAEISSVHISIEPAQTPDSPQGQTEASVDLPLQPEEAAEEEAASVDTDNS